MAEELKEAIQLIKSGEKEAGKNLLIRLVKNDPYDENAWLWLASVTNGEQRIYCLQKALAINPQNEKARAYLEKLKQDKPAKIPAIENKREEKQKPEEKPIQAEPSHPSNLEEEYLKPDGTMVFKPKAETVLITQIIPKLVLLIFVLIYISFTDPSVDMMVLFITFVVFLFALGLNYLLSMSGIYHIRLRNGQLNGPMLMGYPFLHQNIDVEHINLNKTRMNWGFMGVYNIVSVQKSQIFLIGFDKETLHDLLVILDKKKTGG